jgi:hypothetical protein
MLFGFLKWSFWRLHYLVSSPNLHIFSFMHNQFFQVKLGLLPVWTKSLKLRKMSALSADLGVVFIVCLWCLGRVHFGCFIENISKRLAHKVPDFLTHTINMETSK